MTESAHPWLEAPIAIAKTVLDRVDAHALREYPDESCGFIVGPHERAGLLDEAIEAVNLANKYHAVDPETFPRTARTFYMINARVIEKTFEQGQKQQRPVKVIYHSHTDVGAYFSAEDQAAAAPEGALSYPVLFLVTSVRSTGVDDHKIFAFRAGTWHEVPFTVVSRD